MKLVLFLRQRRSKRRFVSFAAMTLSFTHPGIYLLDIRYSVLKVSDDFRKNFQWLVDEIARHGINTERHIIFCHRADDMKNLFRYFSTSLGSKQYFVTNDGVSNDKNRFFAMYHQKTDPEVQETVRSSFCQLDGVIRVLFCTVAFGMGVDVKGVNTIIHYGPARDIDDYLQESGRGGCNSKEQGHALLLNFKGSTRGPHISKEMRQYISDSTQCKRTLLLKDLQELPAPKEGLHNCCSICAMICKCQCVCNTNCSCPLV